MQTFLHVPHIIHICYNLVNKGKDMTGSATNYILPHLDINVSQEFPTLSMSVDRTLAGKIAERLPQHQESISFLLDRLVLIDKSSNEVAAWDINLEPIGRQQDGRLRTADLRTLNDFLGAYLYHSFLDEGDSEPLAVFVGNYRGMNDTGRLAMAAEVRWPIAPPEVLHPLATSVMRRAALGLNYADGLLRATDYHYYDHLVYAQISRENGVTLETNEMGSCSLGTDGMEYDSDAPIFNISAHNLYGVDQQLICLTGLLAIAQADKILQQQG